MAHIIFYEKPGCRGNAKQKALLAQAGHTLEARSLLAWPWTRESLLAFLQPLPVSQWFNRAAPSIKSGQTQPETLTADAALALLLTEPLLIRRPLMESAGQRMVGFETDRVHAWVGLGQATDTLGGRTLEGCAASPAKAGTCGEKDPQ